jgi:hypothetical protein
LSRRRNIRAGGVLGAALVLACFVPSAYGNSLELISDAPNGASNGTWWSAFDGASADGTRVIFDTALALTSDDLDGQPDLYERVDGVTTRISTGPDGGNGNYENTFKAISDDGRHVFWVTGEPLVSSDTDGLCYAEAELIGACSDVYERFNGVTTLVSTGPNGGNGDFHARLRGISKDGTRAFFGTDEPLLPGDGDTASADIYERSGGTTKLISTGPVGGTAELDAFFKGSSDDGTHVFFQTEEQLTGADTDSQADVYERSGGTTTLVSTGTTGGNGAFGSSFKWTSSDGSRVVFETDERLTSADTDSNTDVYQRAGGTTTLLSTGPTGGNGAVDAFFGGATKDGTHVWIETRESLVAADTDGRQDVYERSGGTTTLTSTGPSGGNGSFDASFQAASDDASRAWIGTFERLAPTDTDSVFDIYERSGGTTSQVSLGPAGGNGTSDSFFDGASADGSRVFFESYEPLVSSDTDTYVDVYQRYRGATTLLSGPAGTSTSYSNFLGSNDNGTRVFFETGDSLVSADTDGKTDVYASLDTGAYPRPRGATPFSVPLVIAYQDCTSANTTHGAPLANPSCRPPVPTSSWLTVGTPDSNGLPVKSTGVVVLNTIVGDSSTPADEADLRLQLSVLDVRRKSDLADYAGELQVKTSIRVTDKLNGASPVDPGTVQDIPYSFTGTCATTGDTTVGSTCTVDTTADALVPGTIVESRRAIWQLGTVEVYDGGSDGDVDTAPNTLFERQGIFVP